MPKRVTDAELALLEVIWRQGACTIRRLAEQVYASAGASQCATVQKLLERLEAKGCVRRDRAVRAHCFEAVVTREELIGGRLEELADRLCGGSLTPLLVHLVQPARLSAAQRQELRKLLDESSSGPAERKRQEARP